MPRIVHTTPEYRVRTRRDYIANSTRTGGILHLEHMERLAKIAFSPQHGIVDAPDINFCHPDTMSEIHRKLTGITPQERFAQEVRKREKVIVAENAFHLAHLRANESEKFRRGRHMALFPSEHELQEFCKVDDQLHFKAKARQREFEEITLDNRRLLSHLHGAVPHVQRTKALGDWYQNVHLKRLKQLRRFKKAEPFAGAEALKENIRYARQRLLPSFNRDIGRDSGHRNTLAGSRVGTSSLLRPSLVHGGRAGREIRREEEEREEMGHSEHFHKGIRKGSRSGSICSNRSNEQHTSGNWDRRRGRGRRSGGRVQEEAEEYEEEEGSGGGSGLLDRHGELQIGCDGGPSRLRRPPRRWKHAYPPPSYAAFERAAELMGKPAYPTSEDEEAVAREALERETGGRRHRRPRPPWKGFTVRDIPLLHYISDTALLSPPRGLVSRATEAPVSQLWRKEVEGPLYHQLNMENKRREEYGEGRRGTRSGGDPHADENVKESTKKIGAGGGGETRVRGRGRGRRVVEREKEWEADPLGPASSVTSREVASLTSLFAPPGVAGTMRTGGGGGSFSTRIGSRDMNPGGSEVGCPYPVSFLPPSPPGGGERAS